MTTIADSLAPEVLEMITDEFLMELDDYVATTFGGWDCDDTLSEWLGYRTGASLWDAMWRFGIIVDDDITNLGCLWQPNGVIANGYYVPDDDDTSVPLVTIDQPPSVAVAWDAK